MSRIRSLAVIAPGVALALAVVARDAQAWDSICNEYADPTRPVLQLGAPSGRGCEGMIAARGRWRDPVHWLDEHRVIFRHAVDRAGLPAALLETIVLAVPTLATMLDVGGGRQLPELWPRPLDDGAGIVRLERRGFALDELAQLPDFSYSLADWAGGNERCPVPDLADEAAALGGPIPCHRFKTHMGALNASHFPPQSDRWFQWMHGLARSRADQCRATRAAAWTSFGDATAAAAFDARWTPIWRECEVEALALEAVAQHYLQDSWSSGHMWQRWGSSALAAFPPVSSRAMGIDRVRWNGVADDGRRLMIGEIIGLFVGTIHGSDAPQFEALQDSWLLPPTLADPVCYPLDATIGYGAGAATVAAAGDMHLHDVLGDPLASQLFGLAAEALHRHYLPALALVGHTDPTALATQRDAMMTCASGGAREVYDHLADPATFGATTFGAPTGAAPPPPGAGCAGPRLTAHAIAAGFENQLAASAKFRLAVFQGAVLTTPPSDVDARAFRDYDEARRVSELFAKYAPTSTAPAELSWTDFGYDEEICTPSVPDGTCVYGVQRRVEPAGELRFFDVGRNQEYATAAGVAPATYADPPLPWGDPQQPQALVNDSPEQVLASTFHRAHAPLWCARTDAAELTAFQDRARTAPPAARPDACRVCTEVVARHVRPGVGAKSLCEVLQPGSVVIAGDGDATRVAESRCGCADTVAAIADDGLHFVRVEPTGAITAGNGPYPTGTLTRDATSASRNRIFVTTGQGDIVGFRWAGVAAPAAVELDLTPTDPATTRFRIGGDPRGVAFVQSLGKDWLLVVDNASDLLRVYDLGDENLEKFQLCSTVDVGRDPARVEGTWDLVVKADGSRAWLSIRGGIATPGDAIAMIDLLGLFTCDGQNPPVSHVTTFGGGQGLGAMALSPDQQYLAVAARLRNLCLDRVFTTPIGDVIVDTQVGCDLVYVLRVAQLLPGPLNAAAPVSFGLRTSLPTRPVSYPYAVAWRPDGSAVAYGSFLGLSPWPLYANMNATGAIALGTLAAPSFPSPSGPLHWSYNAPVGGSIAGETVEFTRDGGSIVAGALDGKLYTFPASPTHDFWQNRDSDPETQLHAGAILRSWYGGCRTNGACPGGFCPLNCPAGAADAVKVLVVGSPVRKLLRL